MDGTSQEQCREGLALTYEEKNEVIGVFKLLKKWKEELVANGHSLPSAIEAPVFVNSSD